MFDKETRSFLLILSSTIIVSIADVYFMRNCRPEDLPVDFFVASHMFSIGMIIRTLSGTPFSTEDAFRLQPEFIPHLCMRTLAILVWTYHGVIKEKQAMEYADTGPSAFNDPENFAKRDGVVILRHLGFLRSALTNGNEYLNPVNKTGMKICEHVGNSKKSFFVFNCCEIIFVCFIPP